jgi:outer membrane protein assembly factor BamB
MDWAAVSALTAHLGQFRLVLRRGRKASATVLRRRRRLPTARLHHRLGRGDRARCRQRQAICQPVAGPMRTAPTVSGGRVFAVTIDNQLEVLSADDGRKLWNQPAISETAGLMGGSSPAVEADAVVAAFTSGELFAMRVENGRVAWQDNLAAVRRVDAISDLADIRGRPIIDRGTVFAVSHSGRMVAIDLRTGNRIWEQEIGSLESPWLAGDYIYVLTPDSEVVCLSRGDGRIRWVRPLPRYRREVERKDPLF